MFHLRCFHAMCISKFVLKFFVKFSNIDIGAVRWCSIILMTTKSYLGQDGIASSNIRLTPQVVRVLFTHTSAKRQRVWLLSTHVQDFSAYCKVFFSKTSDASIARSTFTLNAWDRIQSTSKPFTSDGQRDKSDK